MGKRGGRFKKLHQRRGLNEGSVWEIRYRQKGGKCRAQSVTPKGKAFTAILI